MLNEIIEKVYAFEISEFFGYFIVSLHKTKIGAYKAALKYNYIDYQNRLDERYLYGKSVLSEIKTKYEVWRVREFILGE